MSETEPDDTVRVMAADDDTIWVGRLTPVDRATWEALPPTQRFVRDPAGVNGEPVLLRLEPV